jgi:hypothetical protein
MSAYDVVLAIGTMLAVMFMIILCVGIEAVIKRRQDPARTQVRAEIPDLSQIEAGRIQDIADSTSFTRLRTDDPEIQEVPRSGRVSIQETDGKLSTEL